MSSIRTVTRTPTGGSLATCPRSLAAGPGTIRERLDRLARNNRESAAKLAALRIDNARLAATIASARKSTGTLPARLSTAAAKQSAAVLAEPDPRIVVKNGMIYREDY